MNILSTIKGIEAKRSELRSKMYGAGANNSKGIQSLYEFTYDQLTLQVRELYHSPAYTQALDKQRAEYESTTAAKFLKASSGLNGMQILMLKQNLDAAI